MYCRMKNASIPKRKGGNVTLQVVTAYLTTFLWNARDKPRKRSFRIGWSPGKDLNPVPPKCKMWATQYTWL
jgi:hypothetical protein